MAKSELGTKRVCPVTGRKFYDLNQTPVVSPYTGEVVPIEVPTSRGRPDSRAAAKRAEEVEPATQDAEFVSLEDADAEASGGKVAAAATDDEDTEAEEVVADDDSTFLEQDEDEDEDVSDIIGGDIDEQEET